MIKQVGLLLSIEDLQNYDYKKIEKKIKNQIIDIVQKELEHSNLDIKFEFDERFNQTVIRVFASIIIDFNTK